MVKIKEIIGQTLRNWSCNYISKSTFNEVLRIPKSSIKSISFALIIFVIGQIIEPARSANLTWEPNGVSAGGSGAWDTSTNYWYNGTNFQSWPTDGSNYAAVFQGQSGTVTLQSSISVNQLIFNIGNYTINSSTSAYVLTLSGVSPSITTNTGNTSITSVIAGASGLIKNGAGSVTLSGANSFTGGLTVTAGTLSLTGANTYTGNNTVSSGATLNVSG
jgi:fibronectin-binding autotransporter adhesin